MMPEGKARTKIDQLLETAGWTVQDMEELNLTASRGVIIRNFPLESGDIAQFP